jgi:hypothetical protein
MVTGQNILKTCSAHDRTIPGLATLEKLPLYHVTPVRDVAKQYGVAPSTETGEILTIMDPLNTIKRGARAANAIMSFRAGTAITSACLQTASSTWLPTSPTDQSFDVIARSLVQEYLDSIGLDWVVVKHDLPVLTGVDPPWRPAVNDVQWGCIRWAFRQRPDNQAAWLELINGIPNGFFNNTRATRKLDADGNPVNFRGRDLNFDFNMNEFISDFGERWAQKHTALNQLFTIANHADCSSDGSTAQLSSTTNVDSVWTYRNFISNNKTEASLAAAYRPKSFKAGDRRPFVASAVAQAAIPQLKRRWVEKCLIST